MSCRHTQYADLLFHLHQIPVFVNYLEILALEGFLVLLRLADGNLHAGSQRIVELGDRLAVHTDATALQYMIDFGLARPLESLQQPFQQRRRLADHIMVILIGDSKPSPVSALLPLIVFLSHISCKSFLVYKFMPFCSIDKKYPCF